MFRQSQWIVGLFCLVIVVAYGAPAQSAPITSGSVQFVFDNNSPLFSGSGGPLTLNRWYGPGVATLTGPQITSGTGGDPIVTPPDLVTEEAFLNGASVVNPTGRARQTTNLDVAFNNVLATWGPTEQVGVDAVLRTTAPGPSTLVLGDFSLVNSSGTLTLVNNFSFPASAFTIGSPVFMDLGYGFSVSGTLSVAGDLATLLFLSGFPVPVGTPVGTFSMVAVPEPAVAGVACVGVAALILARRRSRMRVVREATPEADRCNRTPGESDA